MDKIQAIIDALDEWYSEANQMSEEFWEEYERELEKNPLAL